MANRRCTHTPLTERETDSEVNNHRMCLYLPHLLALYYMADKYCIDTLQLLALEHIHEFFKDILLSELAEMVRDHLPDLEALDLKLKKEVAFGIAECYGDMRMAKEGDEDAAMITQLLDADSSLCFMVMDWLAKYYERGD